MFSKGVSNQKYGKFNLMQCLNNELEYDLIKEISCALIIRSLMFWW
jgi:hypothetical protein